MKKFFLIGLLLFAMQISAYSDYDFKRDGIYYSITSDSTLSVGAPYLQIPGNQYTGDIVIPSSVVYQGKIYSVTGIQTAAFQGCPKMTSITIPNTVTKIEGYAFQDCSGLTSIRIPDSVKSIERWTFVNCKGLTSITIPDSVKSIGEWAFLGCTGLTSVIIPNSVTSIGESAFDGCSGLTTITIPNSVTSIGERAFQNCSALTSITIPNSVTTIGRYTFDWCSSLSSVTLSDSLTSIGEAAFRGCSLISLTIPNSVTSIGGYAFDGCSGLTSITIPNSVTSIGYGAFGGCSGLTSITIPNSVTSIGVGAFSGCNGLKSLVVDSGNKIYDSRNNCNAVIETMANVLVAGCPSTVIPANVTSIDERAFESCSALTSITIPDSVTSIGHYAFANCSGLTSITIPNSLTYVDELAFSGVGSSSSPCKLIVESGFDNAQLGTIYSDEKSGSNYYMWCGGYFAEPIITGSDNELYYELNSDSKSLSVISGDNKYTGDIVIPASAKYKGKTYPVTRIGSYSFSDCTALTSVRIPNSVTSIGARAFSGCSGLKSIIVDSKNTVYDSRDNCNAIIETASNTLILGCATTNIPNSIKSIGNSAFADCISLSSIEIPNSVIKIGKSAFEDCLNLSSITISNSVTSIGQEAFSGCNKLMSISIPNSIKNIENYIFKNCISLTSIQIPNSVTRIGNYAFEGCVNITSVTIPNSVKNIGVYAFSNCNKLQSVTIPNNVKSIVKYTFRNCISLKYIVIPNSVTAISDYAFEHCSGLASVTITNSATSIAGTAFSGVGALTSPCKLIVSSEFYNSMNGDKHKGENGNPDYYIWKEGYFTDPITSEEITINENRYLAFIPNIDMDFSSTIDVSAYTVVYDNNNILSMYPQKTVHSGVPVILIGEPSTYSIYYTYGVSDAVANDLRVADSATVADGSQWLPTGVNTVGADILSAPAAEDGTTINFSKIPVGTTIPAGQVYLYIPAGTVSGDTLTGVNDATQGQASNIIGIYDLNGRRTDVPQKGINIIRYQDGTTKKIILK